MPYLRSSNDDVYHATLYGDSDEDERDKGEGPTTVYRGVCPISTMNENLAVYPTIPLTSPSSVRTLPESPEAKSLTT